MAHHERHTVPDLPSDTSSSSDTEPESNASESSRVPNAAINLEAEESDGSESAEEVENEFYNGQATFHRFMDLPPEMRDYIWELYCPDLDGPRVLPMSLCFDSCDPDADWGTGRNNSVGDTLQLGLSTANFRDFSRISRDTRNRAIQYAPDTMSFCHRYSRSGERHSVVRYNRKRDMILLEEHRDNCHGSHPGRQPVDGASRKPDLAKSGPIHVGVELDAFSSGTVFSDGGFVKNIVHQFPGASSIYLTALADTLAIDQKQWVASANVYRHKQEWTELSEADIPMTYQRMFCWADTEVNPIFKSTWWPRFSEDFEMGLEDWDIAELQGKGYHITGAVKFDNDGWEYDYQRILGTPTGRPLRSEWDDSEEEDEEEEEDEYESEGIDDAEIIENEESSEDEEVPRSISPGSLGSPRSSPQSSPEPLSAAPPVIAVFSSPEPSEDEDQPSEPVNRRKRRIVSDSDDEDGDPDAGDQPNGGQSPVKRRRLARTLASDSDEEEESSKSATAQDDTPIAVSSSPVKTTARRRFRFVEASASPSEVDDEEDETPAKPLTLAQRLKIQPKSRITRPIRAPSDDDDDEEDDEEDEDDSGSSDDEEAGPSRRVRSAFFDDEASGTEDDDGDDGGEDDSFISDG